MKKDFNRKMHRFASALGKIDMEKHYLEAAKETEDLALDLNKTQLYDQGVDSKGKSTGKYADSTKKQKQKKGQRSDHITLSDSFKFYDKMFLDTRQIPILIDSRDSKTPILEAKVPNALGLTTEHTQQYKKTLNAIVQQKVSKQIEDLKEKILS